MRLKVLISAYACEPGKGSEPAVGWNVICQGCKYHDIWVITRSNNRGPIEAAVACDPLQRVEFIYFDLPKWSAFWKKGRRGVQVYYYIWQIGAYLVARRLQRQIGFDVLHHVTLVKYWVPSFLALLPLPFLWGPVGGGDTMPPGLLSTLSWRGRAYEVVRHLARSLASFDPFLRLTARRATLALATTFETKERLCALGCKRVLTFSQVGLKSEDILSLNCHPLRSDKCFRVVSVGELLHLKGFHLGLVAFARLHRRFPTSECWLIGGGPERRRLERLAKRLNVSESVTFWGTLPRSEVMQKLKMCDVLLQPALHDSGGYAVVEAMAVGLPVVCLNLGGIAFQVTEETGIKVSATSPEQTVTELAAAITELARDTSRRALLGQAASKRVFEQFNWDTKGAPLSQIYSQLASV